MRILHSVRIISALFVSLLIVPVDVFSQEAQKNELRLTLREGAIKVLENNLDISVEKISPGIAEARVQSARGVYDLEAFGSLKREDSTTPLSARSSAAARGLSSLESETNSFQAGMTGKLQTGAEYTLQVQDSWTADTLNEFEEEFTSFTGVTVTQPLFRNYGAAANNAQINIARKNRDISINQFRQRVLDIITDFGTSFWDLVRVKEELKVRIESQELAETLLRQSRKRLEAGAISPLEVIQAEAAASARKDDVIVARKAVRDAEDRLKLLISADVYELRDSEIIPLGNGSLNPVLQTLNESIETAISKRPDYGEIKNTIERNRIQIRYSENQRFPKIDLEASYGLNGLGPSFSDSFRQVDDNPQWSVGLVFRYPLGNNAATGDYKAAKLEASQSVLRLKKLEQQIIINIDNAIKDIESDRKRVDETRIAVNLARESLVAEDKKLLAGRSTTFNVLKVQEDLARAHSTESTAISDYNKALIRYYKEKGILLEELGITASDK